MWLTLKFWLILLTSNYFSNNNKNLLEVNFYVKK